MHTKYKNVEADFLPPKDGKKNIACYFFPTLIGVVIFVARSFSKIGVVIAASIAIKMTDEKMGRNDKGFI